MAQVFKFGKDEWDPTRRFETSWCLPPVVLGALRALIALYAFVTLIFILAYKCADAANGGCSQSRDEFSYFTVLTYWGIAFYFGVAALHTLAYARTGRSSLARFPRVLQALHALLYTTVVAYPFLVTAVYWGVLYSGAWFPRVFDGWSNVSRHLLNTVFALLELVLPRTARPLWIHMLWLIVIEALYLGLAYITRATKGFYPYDFLDPAWKGSGVVAGYILGIAVACCLAYLLAHGIIALRVFITEKKLRMNGKFAKKRVGTPDSEAAAKMEEKTRPVS